MPVKLESMIFCIFGVLTNSLNAVVFIHPKMKDISFKYLLIISLSEIFYLGIESMKPINDCDECKINKYFSYQIYYVYFTDYLSRGIALFIILCEILLSIQRYMVLLNKEFLKPNSLYYFVLGLFLISGAIYLPIAFRKRIVLIENSNTSNISSVQGYKHELNEFGQSSTGKTMFVVITLMRASLGSVVIFSLNILIWYEYNKRKRRQEIIQINNNLSRLSLWKAINRKRQLTFSIMCSSFLFAFGQLPYLIVKSLNEITPQTSVVIRNTLTVIFLSHSLNIFIYFAFNKLFRKVLVSYFRSFFFICY